MLRKRTTAPGVSGPTGRPERPVKGRTRPSGGSRRRGSRGRRSSWRASAGGWHRPTMAQLRTMAGFGGRQPSTYRLDRAVNWLPESLPVDFPHGAERPALRPRGRRGRRAARRLRVRARLAAARVA